MVITVEGAKLLAQFIPVLILILAVERRLIGPEPEPVRIVGWIWYWTKGVVQCLGAAGALISMSPLILSVNTNQPIVGGIAVAVFLFTYLIGQAVLSVVVTLVFRGYFGSPDAEHLQALKRRKFENASDLRRTRRARKLARRRLSARGRGREPISVPVAPRS